MIVVAMVETLNNRIQDDKLKLEAIGLVIVFIRHYIALRKIVHNFEHYCFMLGVTATPLSFHFKLPMKHNYEN
jgi:superfamily II DNA or RNA helicase